MDAEDEFKLRNKSVEYIEIDSKTLQIMKTAAHDASCRGMENWAKLRRFWAFNFWASVFLTYFTHFFFMKTTCTPRIKVLNYSFHKIYQNLMFAIPTEKYLIMVHYKAIVHEHEIFIFVCGDFFPADMYLKSISISWDGSSQSSAKSTEQKRQSDIAFLLLIFFKYKIFKVIFYH